MKDPHFIAVKPAALAVALFTVSALALQLTLSTISFPDAGGNSAALAATPPDVVDLKFPDDVIVATMQYPLGLCKTILPPPQFRARVKARGLIRLPRDRDIELKLTFDGLQNLQYLKQLNACRVTSLESSGLDFEDNMIHFLKPLQQLRKICLEDCMLTDKSLAELSTFPQLLELSVGRTCIDGSGLGSLKDVRTLRSLGIEGNILKPGTVLLLKPRLADLVSINLTRTNLQKKDAVILKDLTSAIVINLAENRQIDDQCMEHLRGLNHLRTLRVHDTAVTDKSIGVFAKLPALTTVVIRDKTFWKTRPKVSKIGRIEFLDAEQLSNAPAEVFTPLH